MLKLEIAGHWEPQDFVEILRSIESFYYKMLIGRSLQLRLLVWLDEACPLWTSEQFDIWPCNTILDQINAKMLARARFEAPPDNRLNVAAIQYASPGSIDLLGIGKVFETVVSSIGRLTTYSDEAPLRKEREKQARLETKLKQVELAKERQNLLALQIQNAENVLRLSDMRPGVREILEQLLVRDQDLIATLITEGKIISASIAPSAKDKD